MSYKELFCDSIFVTPVKFDFSKNYWCCVSDIDFQPCFNKIFPLSSDFDLSAYDDLDNKLHSCQIILVDDEYYLTLSGCGSNFCWEICETYIDLGYYPPIHFVNLPDSRDNSDDNLKILHYCKISLDKAKRQLENSILRLNKIF